ncbi:MAG TPA: GDP-mannose 4,6-dehydratase [Pirellulaceae bacterium]|nr:GDP-mannose 4,6-dehydratase [Pirellulaceae bacterium]
MSQQFILVTGCAGFIGARTAELLLQRGQAVLGVDNLNDYYDVRLKQHRLDGLRQHPEFQFELLDMADQSGVQRLFDSYPIASVINLAARAGVRYSLINPQVYVQTNVLGSVNLMEAMRRGGIRKYVLASTSSLYAGQPMPFVETLPVNEPISPYAATKKAAEVMAFAYHHLFQLDVTVLRYFTVYGPAGRPDMSYFRFIRWIDQGQPVKLYGTGSQSRDFTYVDDIARGTIAGLKPLGFEIINLGGGQQPYRIMELISRIEALLNKTAQIDRQAEHPADVTETWADIAKAARLLDWRPEISLDEGLRRTVAWYRDHHSWVCDLKQTD